MRLKQPLDEAPLDQGDVDHPHDAPSQTQWARSDNLGLAVLHFPQRGFARTEPLQHLVCTIPIHNISQRICFEGGL